MCELYRVLKDDVVCIILIPQFNLETTLENDEYNTPELRRKYYGQEDYLTKYGLDFKDRLLLLDSMLKSLGLKIYLTQRKKWTYIN